MAPQWDIDKLQQLLDERGLTESDLAALMGYAPRTIEHTFKGRQPFNDKFVARASIALGVPLPWFLKEEEPVEVAS